MQFSSIKHIDRILSAKAMKGYSAFPKAPAPLELHPQIV